MAKIKIVIKVISSNIGLLARKIIGCKINYFFKNLVSINCSLRTYGKGKIDIGEKVEIRPNTEITSRNGLVKIGYNCFINRNCMIISHDKIILEKKVTIGPGTVIYDHDHDSNGGYITKPILIKEGAWIGANCVILKGVEIGANSVIAAGTVVTKDVPDNCIVYDRRIKEEYLRG